MGVSVLITAALIGYAWYNYFSSVDNATNKYEKDVILGYTIMYTFVTILFFLLSMTGIGILLVGLVYLLDFILFGCCDINLMEEIYSIAASVGDLTKLNDVTMEGVSLYVPGGGGMREGGALRMYDKFTGEMTAELAEGKVNLQGTSGDLFYYSRSAGFYMGSSTSDYDFSTYYGAVGCDIHNNYLIDAATGTRRATQHCSNTPQATFIFKQPSTAMRLEAQFKIFVRRRQWVCNIVSGCFPAETNLVLPDDLPDENKWEALSFVVDVLPATIDGIWTWDELYNRDMDGDGIAFPQESVRGSSDLDPDSDNDG